MKMRRCFMCDRRRPASKIQRMRAPERRICTDYASCDRELKRAERAYARRVLSRPEWPQHAQAWRMWQGERDGGR